MNWKQKALMGVMAGAFGLRWLAGRDVGADGPAVARATAIIETGLSWVLVLALIVLLGQAGAALLRLLRGRVTGARAEAPKAE